MNIEFFNAYDMVFDDLPSGKAFVSRDNYDIMYIKCTVESAYRFNEDGIDFHSVKEFNQEHIIIPVKVISIKLKKI